MLARLGLHNYFQILDLLQHWLRLYYLFWALCEGSNGLGPFKALSWTGQTSYLHLEEQMRRSQEMTRKVPSRRRVEHSS